MVAEEWESKFMVVDLIEVSLFAHCIHVVCLLVQVVRSITEVHLSHRSKKYTSVRDSSDIMTRLFLLIAAVLNASHQSVDAFSVPSMARRGTQTRVYATVEKEVGGTVQIAAAWSHCTQQYLNECIHEGSGSDDGG